MCFFPHTKTFLLRGYNTSFRFFCLPPRRNPLTPLSLAFLLAKSFCFDTTPLFFQFSSRPNLPPFPAPLPECSTRDLFPLSKCHIFISFLYFRFFCSDDSLVGTSVISPPGVVSLFDSSFETLLGVRESLVTFVCPLGPLPLTSGSSRRS